MSKINLTPNASGTGVFTIASPNSNTDRTFDLPDGAGTIAVASQLDNHNLIINGDGGVNQRGYTSGTATTGANQYTLDRWRVVTSGESLTFTGNEAGRTMTAPSGGVEQVIEGLNIAGGTYVITWTGTATGAVDGTTVSSGDTVTLTANTNATVKFTSGTFTNVKVEEGSIATPFRKRGYGEELAQCQRYFIRYSNETGTTTSLAFPTFAWSGGSAYGNVFFPATMRAIPTFVQSGTNIFRVYINGGSYVQTGSSLGVAGTSCAEIYTYGTSVSGFTRFEGTTAWCHFDAEL